MFTFLVIITSLVVILLILVASVRPERSLLSSFELQRRSKKGHKDAEAILHREELLSDLYSLQRIAVSFLLVIMVIVSIVTFGWLIGVIVAILVAFEYGAIGRISAVHSVAENLFRRIEPSLLRFVSWAEPVFTFIRSAPLESTNRFRRIDSREELQHMVDSSDGVLSPEEKKLISNGLSFADKQVASIMTPKGMIDSVKKSEFLGPLVLSELHNLGHSRLPVIAADIDHVVGILYVRDLLSLHAKQSVTAEKAMDPKVFYIHQNDTLDHALAAFLKTHHHLFVVVNDFRETVGLLSLEDVIEALLGRKIIDEDDNHEDIRTIATSNPRGNNVPESHVDV